MVIKYIIMMLGRIIRIKLDIENTRVSKLSILDAGYLGNILIFLFFFFLLLFFWGVWVCICDGAGNTNILKKFCSQSVHSVVEEQEDR